MGRIVYFCNEGTGSSRARTLPVMEKDLEMNPEGWETIRCDADAAPEERVKAMERAFDRTRRVVSALEEALDAFESNRGTMDELSDYMVSGLWLKDFELDGEGWLPAGLKRGVLSEDSLYDLLCEIDELQKRLEGYAPEAAGYGLKGFLE